MDMMVTIPRGHPLSGGGVRNHAGGQQTHTDACRPPRQTAAHNTVLLICQAVLKPDAGHSQGLLRNRNHQSHFRVAEQPSMVQALCCLQKQGVHDIAGYKTASQYLHGCLHYQLWCIVPGRGLPHRLSPAGVRRGQTDPSFSSWPSMR